MCENTIELSSVIGLVLRLMLADDLASVDVMKLNSNLLVDQRSRRETEREVIKQPTCCVMQLQRLDVLTVMPVA